jgi:hypothetical protein
MATETKIKEEIQTPSEKPDEELAKILSTFDMDKTMHYFIGLLGMLGDMSSKLGELEKENSEVPTIIKFINENPRLFLNKLLEKASGDEIKALIMAMLRLDELTPKIANLFTLSAEEKISVGKEMESISQEIEVSYKKTKEKKCK